MQDSDYRPYISFDHGKLQGHTEAYESDDDDTATMFSDRLKYEGAIINTGTKPVHLVQLSVLLQPNRREPTVAVLVPLGTSVAPGARVPVTYELPWVTVWGVAKRLDLASLGLDMTLTMIGADRVKREQNTHVGSVIHTEDSLWLALDRADEIEARQELYQWALRDGSRQEECVTGRRSPDHPWRPRG